LQKQDKEKIFSLLKGKTSLAQSYEELQKELGGAVTLDGMNLIATLFIRHLDSVVKLPAVINAGVTREDIINNTHSRYNQDLIFNKLFEYFLFTISKLSENNSPENQKYIENYRKVINNWPAMVVLAKYKLSKIEGVPMQYGNSTVDVDTEFLESVFNQEESTKEGWMEIKDRISSYGSLGVQIKRILATVKEIESVNPDGSVVYKRDSFGQPKTISPMKAHQLIHRIVINSRSSEEMIKSMATDSIVFPMANPTPEIMPDIAKKSGARIVGTGRSDFPNQINNVLAFPGIFRGALDCRAKCINEEMKIATSLALASLIPENELSEENIIPSALDKRVASVVATAVIDAARKTGVARI
jgi:hypothetical protein